MHPNYFLQQNKMQDYEEVVFEAYGPNGVALMIECLTDNTLLASGTRTLTITEPVNDDPEDDTTDDTTDQDTNTNTNSNDPSTGTYAGYIPPSNSRSSSRSSGSSTSSDSCQVVWECDECIY